MISIVIPTRNRRETLERTLGALGAQTWPPGGFEVLVVDNGSSDGTPGLVQDQAATSRATLRLLQEPKLGPAAARNRGVEEAIGDVILFLGDDMVPGSPDFVAAHSARHADCPERTFALLGRVTWDPIRPITTFICWLEHGGPQFDFGSLASGPVSPVGFFYTANVSVKRDVLLEVGGFDERFPFAAVEDVELGGRLADAGIKLCYDPMILVLHDHPTTLAQSLARMVRVGQSARLHDELSSDRPGSLNLSPPARQWYVRLGYPLARLLGRESAPRFLRERAWLILHAAAYRRGYFLEPALPA